MVSLDQLPDVALLHILTCNKLTGSDILTFGRVCKRFYQFANSTTVWKRKCRKRLRFLSTEDSDSLLASVAQLQNKPGAAGARNRKQTDESWIMTFHNCDAILTATNDVIRQYVTNKKVEYDEVMKLDDLCERYNTPLVLKTVTLCNKSGRFYDASAEYFLSRLISALTKVIEKNMEYVSGDLVWNFFSACTPDDEPHLAQRRFLVVQRAMAQHMHGRLDRLTDKILSLPRQLSSLYGHLNGGLRDQMNSLEKNVADVRQIQSRCPGVRKRSAIVDRQEHLHDDMRPSSSSHQQQSSSQSHHHRHRRRQTHHQHLDSTSPVIDIVGMCDGFSHEEIVTSLFYDNECFAHIPDPRAQFHILAIKPTKKSKHIFRIVARVSPAIREAIELNNNFLLILRLQCHVYDNTPPFIRCFRCQAPGHKSNQCTSNDYVCAYCAGPHSTQRCSNRQGPPRCINCIKRRREDVAHPADSKLCPEYLTYLSTSSSRGPGHPTSRHRSEF